MFAPPILELLSGILQLRVDPFNINSELKYGLEISVPLIPYHLKFKDFDLSRIQFFNVEYKTTLRNARKKCNQKCVLFRPNWLFKTTIDGQRSIIGSAYKWPKNYLSGKYFAAVRSKFSIISSFHYAICWV
jgi:hypothetical protein